jgi:hypothetical protein
MVVLTAIGMSDQVQAPLAVRPFAMVSDYYFKGVSYIRHGESNVIPRPELVTRVLAQYAFCALNRVMTGVLKDDVELFRQFSDNDAFRRWLADTVFALTSEEDTSDS